MLQRLRRFFGLPGRPSIRDPRDLLSPEGLAILALVDGGGRLDVDRLRPWARVTGRRLSGRVMRRLEASGMVDVCDRPVPGGIGRVGFRREYRLTVAGTAMAGRLRRFVLNATGGDA